MIEKVIKDYTLKSPIGEGGMAIVYLAEHNTLNKPVAIKLLNKEFIHNDNIRKRFLAEARNLFSMSHPNIIKVTDLIDQEDTVAFVMEYIEGQTLKEYLDTKRKLKDDEIKKLFVQMLDAVGYVHEQGLIHRDIKPSNFLISGKGVVKLLDFGIAKKTDTTSSEYTQTGTTQNMGTPMYMSPEQIKSTKDVTAQSDIYSLGVVLWQMATGKKPYDTNTTSTFELQTKIVNEKLAPTNTLFDEVISGATAKDLKDRYSNCLQFKNQLLHKPEDLESTKLYSEKVFEQTIVQEKVQNNSTSLSLSKKNEIKYLYPLTIIQSLSFIAFLIIFAIKAEAEEKLRRMSMHDNLEELWMAAGTYYSESAGLVSFIFISFNLFSISFLYRKLIIIGNNGWLNVFRISSSIFMFLWTILLYSSPGGIRVFEVQAAWYVYILLEIILNVSTIRKLKYFLKH
jgi:serine/threonine protein kinase